MITSYVTPRRTMLYLSLVGPLDASSARDLVDEYYARQVPGLRQCILDLAAVDQADNTGLDVLFRLSRLTEVDGLDFALVAAGGGAEAAVVQAARHAQVAMVDRRNLPFDAEGSPTPGVDAAYGGGSFIQA